MKLILGTDFSPHAEHAGQVAAGLAHRLEDSLLVIHAFETDRLEPLSARVQQSLETQLRERLDQQVEPLRKVTRPLTAEVQRGAADEVILNQLDPTQARLVVLGSLGQRKPGRWFIGSVAERVAERSPIPTLVVRQEGPLLAWIRGERSLRVFCAFDYSDPSLAALQYLQDLRQIGPLDLTVAQVDWPPAEKHRLGIRGQQPLDANPPEVQRLLERDLRERLASLLGAVEVRLRVEPGWGRPDLRLVEMAENDHADLLLTGTHQRQGLQRLWHASTSRGILLHAPMNVLVVPESKGNQLTPQIPDFQRAVVATDFSPLANHAIPVAYATLPRGGQVKLLTVVPPWVPASARITRTAPRTPSRSQHKQQLAELARQLHQLVPPDAASRGLHTEVEVIEASEVAEAISQAAERFDAQLICLGSHGRTGLSRALLGSVAQNVVARSRRPVVIVRPPAA